MKDKICIVVVMTVIVTIIASGIYLNHKTSDTAYNLAVDLITIANIISFLTIFLPLTFYRYADNDRAYKDCPGYAVRDNLPFLHKTELL